MWFGLFTRPWQRRTHSFCLDGMNKAEVSSLVTIGALFVCNNLQTLQAVTLTASYCLEHSRRKDLCDHVVFPNPWSFVHLDPLFFMFRLVYERFFPANDASAACFLRITTCKFAFPAFLLQADSQQTWSQWLFFASVLTELKTAREGVGEVSVAFHQLMYATLTRASTNVLWRVQRIWNFKFEAAIR